jgi:hypothetical protein
MMFDRYIEACERVATTQERAARLYVRSGQHFESSARRGSRGTSARRLPGCARRVGDERQA